MSRDSISDVSKKMESWYLGERLPNGASGIENNRNIMNLETHASLLPFVNGTRKVDYEMRKNKIYMATYLSDNKYDKKYCLKNVFQDIEIVYTRGRNYVPDWRIRLPNDVRVPYAMREMNFSPAILDVQVVNEVQFEIQKADGGDQFEFESPVPFQPTPNLRKMMKDSGECVYNGPSGDDDDDGDKEEDDLRERVSNTMLSDKGGDLKLRAHFTIVMDPCNGDVSDYAKKHGPVDDRTKYQILETVANQMIEMYEKLRFVYTNMKLRHVLYKAKDNEPATFHVVDFGSFYKIGEECVQTYTTPLLLDTGGVGFKKNMGDAFSTRANFAHGIWSLYVLFHLMCESSLNPLTYNSDGEESRDMVSMMKSGRLVSLGKHDDAVSDFFNRCKTFVALNNNSFKTILLDFLHTVIRPILHSGYDMHDTILEGSQRPLPSVDPPHRHAVKRENPSSEPSSDPAPPNTVVQGVFYENDDGDLVEVGPNGQPVNGSSKRRVFNMPLYIDSMHRLLNNPSGSPENGTLMKLSNDFCDAYSEKHGTVSFQVQAFSYIGEEDVNDLLSEKWVAFKQAVDTVYKARKTPQNPKGVAIRTLQYHHLLTAVCTSFNDFVMSSTIYRNPIPITNRPNKKFRIKME